MELGFYFTVLIVFFYATVFMFLTEMLFSVSCLGTTDANWLLSNSGTAKKQYTVPVK